jgi:hypothetical protein
VLAAAPAFDEPPLCAAEFAGELPERDAAAGWLADFVVASSADWPALPALMPGRGVLFSAPVALGELEVEGAPFTISSATRHQLL